MWLKCISRPWTSATVSVRKGALNGYGKVAGSVRNNQSCIRSLTLNYIMFTCYKKGNLKLMELDMSSCRWFSLFNSVTQEEWGKHLTDTLPSTKHFKSDCLLLKKSTQLRILELFIKKRFGHMNLHGYKKSLCLYTELQSRTVDCQCCISDITESTWAQRSNQH